MTLEALKKVSVETVNEISNFLYEEAYLLDHRRYEEWLQLLADDLVYRMPLRVTVEGTSDDSVLEDMTFFEESKGSMTTRVKRLYTKSAWVENPAPRQRHFISNIRVVGTDVANEYKVTSYFLFKRSRASDHQTEEIFGERTDIIRKLEDGFEVVKRTIYPDQTIITAMNLSMFL